MKKINQYFYAGCIAYTVASTILIVMCLIKNKGDFQVKSYASMLIIIIFIQIILYFMENLQVKSQFVHMSLELFMIIIITFTLGMPTKLIRIESIYDVIEIITMLILTYGITILSLYLNSRNDANYINRMLKERR
ncbi:hypothetical protein [Clostridium drakei]|uniref:DUF3021 domain-containing protein n=1 Tax=Clostridium drakei TaxID=332101 RepID=A0A2U8DQP8_9CLOT|nr:hypothetical protein [Clostridium drakei]AWI04811.1 hypothetical protein B9W14_10000 [Clostridium drakei]